jgi:polyphosphate kinase 2 (PPK2 family)
MDRGSGAAMVGAANQRLIEATHLPEALWHIVPADDKRAPG